MEMSLVAMVTKQITMVTFYGAELALNVFSLF